MIYYITYFTKISVGIFFFTFILILNNKKVITDQRKSGTPKINIMLTWVHTNKNKKNRNTHDVYCLLCYSRYPSARFTLLTKVIYYIITMPKNDLNYYQSVAVIPYKVYPGTYQDHNRSEQYFHKKIISPLHGIIRDRFSWHQWNMK